MSTTSTHIAKIATVVVPVADQDRALEFYVGTLGLQKRVDIPFGEKYRWVEVGPAGAETTIALAPPPQDKPAGNTQTGISLYTDDIDAVHAHLQASGADVDEQVSRMGGPVPPLLWVRDPENNSLMFVGAQE